MRDESESSDPLHPMTLHAHIRNHYSTLAVALKGPSCGLFALFASI
jgi:hypothetical protein